MANLNHSRPNRVLQYLLHLPSHTRPSRKVYSLVFFQRKFLERLNLRLLLPPKGNGNDHTRARPYAPAAMEKGLNTKQPTTTNAILNYSSAVHGSSKTETSFKLELT